MKSIYLTTGLALVFAAGLTACNQAEQSTDETPPAVIADATDTEPATDAPDIVQPATSQIITAVIDWDAAARDRAANPPSEDGLVSIQAVGGEPPAVPILILSGNVSIASADGTGGPRLRQLSDGYFAAYPGPVYDIIVNGTNQIITVDDTAHSRNDDMIFTASVAGAQVALSRYGADYLVEFECHEIDDASGTCITEEEALAVAETLLVAG